MIFYEKRPQKQTNMLPLGKSFGLNLHNPIYFTLSLDLTYATLLKLLARLPQSRALCLKWSRPKLPPTLALESVGVSMKQHAFYYCAWKNPMLWFMFILNIPNLHRLKLDFSLLPWLPKQPKNCKSLFHFMLCLW